MPSLLIEVTEENYPQFLMQFLLLHPVPIDSQMSEDEWVKDWFSLLGCDMARVGFSLTTSEEKQAEFRAAFLAVYPVPLDPVTNEPTMTEAQRIKEKVLKMAWEPYRLGLKVLHKRAHPTTPDPEILT